MFCPNCGTQLPDGARFCTNCGKEFASYVNAAQPAPATQPAPQVEPAPVAPVVPITMIPAQRNNVMCLVGFWTSIMSIMTGGTFSGITLILSIIGLVTAKKKNENGQGLAKAGIIISSIMTVVFGGAIVYGVWTANQ